MHINFVTQVPTSTIFDEFHGESAKFSDWTRSRNGNATVMGLGAALRH